MEAIRDYSAFLKEAKSAVEELCSLEAQRDQMEAKLRQDKRLLEAEKKATDDEIRKTTKNRLDDITSGYDKQISKGQEQLRKAKSRRETAKGKGMRERIVEETSDLRDDNRRIKLQIKTLFQQWRIPAYCNTKLYYALHYPRWFDEFMILILAVLICFLAVPFGSYLLIPDRKVWHLVLSYFLCILIFGGAYVFIGRGARDEHGDILREGRNLRNEMHANDKRMKIITKNIRKDRNDSVYNLGKYDDEIAQIQQTLSETTEKKRDAINTFETVTKNIIFDEITASHKERIDELTAACEQEDWELKRMEAAVQDKQLYVTDRYAPYLGKEFLTPERLEALLDIMEHGTASNLSEAMQMYRRSRS